MDNSSSPHWSTTSTVDVSSNLTEQLMSRSSSSPFAVLTSYRTLQVPVAIAHPGFRFSALSYSYPPPYITPSYPTQYNSNSSSLQMYTSRPSSPFYNSRSLSLTYTPQSSTMPITSQTSKYSRKSKSLPPPYLPPYSCPPYTTQSSMPVYTSPYSSLMYTSQSATTSNKSQTPTFSIRAQSSASSYNQRYPTPTDNTSSFVPIYNSKPPSLRRKPRSAHYSATPSYSHYTFPRSAHYTMPVSVRTYSTVMPQSSTQNSYPSINVWPTEIGSVMHVSMENIWSVLATQLQNESQPSDSTKTASNSEQPERNLMPLYKKDYHYEVGQFELHRAWKYFNMLEVVDIKPNGEIMCICPAIKFVDMLKTSNSDWNMLDMLYQYYKSNNLVFETTYDYNSPPQTTIVTENVEKAVLRWLKSLQMEEYNWFFNSLNLIEIENITPTNIQKFITRSKSNKTISLEDQLKICCIAKKIKERTISFLAISMNLVEERIDEESFRSIVDPFITEICLFPMSIESVIFQDKLQRSFFTAMAGLKINVMKFLNMKTQPNINIIIGNLLNTEMLQQKKHGNTKEK